MQVVMKMSIGVMEIVNLIVIDLKKNIFNDDDINDNLTKELRHRYPRTRLNKLKFGSLSPSPSLLESDEIDLVNSQLSNPRIIMI